MQELLDACKRSNCDNRYTRLSTVICMQLMFDV